MILSSLREFLVSSFLPKDISFHLGCSKDWETIDSISANDILNVFGMSQDDKCRFIKKYGIQDVTISGIWKDSKYLEYRGEISTDTMIHINRIWLLYINPHAYSSHTLQDTF